jgi:hypothetical protein
MTGAFSMTVPSDWKRGSLLGSLFGNFSVYSTFRYTSGTAYSQCGPVDQSVLSSENCLADFPDGINSRRLPAFKELNARFTKSFGLGGLDVTGYLDVRNLLNFRNVIQVFAMNGSVRNDVERDQNLTADLDDLEQEGRLNHALAEDGSLLLDFPHEQLCAGWISTKEFRSAPANCMYLIRAEQRFGNGDGVYTVAEQTAAVNALYDVARGKHQHYGAPRRARLGIQISF